LPGDRPTHPSGLPVHCFKVPLSFARFLKFSLNIWKACEEEVYRLKKQIDSELEHFITVDFRPEA
jgi:hypothetical protein